MVTESQSLLATGIGKHVNQLAGTSVKITIKGWLYNMR
jgi:hypothetical protein